MKCGVLMDPLAHIKRVKDTSFALLLASQQRGNDNYYIEPNGIWLQDGLVWGRMQRVKVFDDDLRWFELEEPISQPLVELDVLFMRKDPPFNMDYVYLTYLLEQAEAMGLLVINKPSSLRDANEKLFAAWFPQCCPKTLVTASQQLVHDFLANEEDIIIKPLDGMGGSSVFRIKINDVNVNPIIENITDYGKHMVMVQQFIPEIINGDKRIILVDGVPIPYALARVPKADDFRGNLAAGARPEGRELTDRDRWICEQVGPTLRKKGLWFVGLDIIGDYLTEINVTSPTGVRELDAIFNLSICDDLLDITEDRLRTRV